MRGQKQLKGCLCKKNEDFTEARTKKGLVWFKMIFWPRWKLF